MRNSSSMPMHTKLDINKISKSDCLGWIDPKTKQWVFVWDTKR